MNFEEKNVYDDAAKEWQIRTYEEGEEVLEARKSVTPEEADRISYDSDGNVILRDDHSIRKQDLHHARCTVPYISGMVLSSQIKEPLWDRYYMATPPRRRQFVEQYKIVRRA